MLRVSPFKHHSLTASFSTSTKSRKMSSFYDFQIKDTAGKPIDLKQFQGKVVLAFNSASKCGYTKQLSGFQSLYESHGQKGLVVIGFPSADFKQELATDGEVAEFCQRNYGVKFPMTEKISVNGGSEHPIYKFFKAALPGDIKWNFEKFLIDTQGKVVKRFPSGVTPETIKADIEKLL